MTLSPEARGDVRPLRRRTGIRLSSRRRSGGMAAVTSSIAPGVRPDRRPRRIVSALGWLSRPSNVANAGKLAGKRIAIKDTIAVAGLPMTDGTDFLTHVPPFDATIVERILDAGGEITGKAVCEYLSYSSGSHTASPAPSKIRSKPGYSTGGSSSGSAALVAAGEVDMAIGGDQAGSIRIPSAHCGLYGLKPTFGRVPYTGAVSSEFVIDHLGPITATVEDNALLLECIAGSDPLDPRTAGAPPPDDYRAALGKNIAGLSIGVVAEGFGHRNSMPEVDATVRRASAQFTRLGAKVETIALPCASRRPGDMAGICDGGLFRQSDARQRIRRQS